jgi:hypothetical protein
MIACAAHEGTGGSVTSLPLCSRKQMDSWPTGFVESNIVAFGTVRESVSI